MVGPGRYVLYNTQFSQNNNGVGVKDLSLLAFALKRLKMSAMDSVKAFDGCPGGHRRESDIHPVKHPNLDPTQEGELRKGFSAWSLGGLCACLMATWEALSSVVALALFSGGAPCLFYN